MPTEGVDLPSVCIAVPTYRRPDQLARLMEALARETSCTLAPRCEVVIVDNDPSGGARALASERAATFPVPLHYAGVRAPGLSVVRNFALARAASAELDALVMIDDDEIPEPGWLAELLRVAATSGADAVAGVVLPRFSEPPSRWILASRFFDPPRYADATVLNECAAGNILIRMAAVRRFGLAFDMTMNLAGGEDQLFTRQLSARGGRIVYAAHAVAYERIDPARATLRYLVQRSLRYGNTWTIGDRKIHRPGLRLALHGLKTAAALMFSRGILPLVPWTIARGRGGAAEALGWVARGCGMLLGVAGIRVLEYARPSHSAEEKTRYRFNLGGLSER